MCPLGDKVMLHCGNIGGDESFYYAFYPAFHNFSAYFWAEY
jgi:hypothetical protein